MNEEINTATMTDSPMGLKPRLAQAQADGSALISKTMPQVLKGMVLVAWNCCRNNFPLVGNKVFGNGESFSQYGELAYSVDPASMATAAQMAVNDASR